MAPIFAAKLPYLSRWSFPLDGYATLRGKRLLGDHKTLRGILVGILTVSVQVSLYQQTALHRSLYHGSFTQFYPSFFLNIQIGWNPRWLAAFGYHLWFLAFLFLISAFTLPLLLLRRRERCVQLMDRLAHVCTR